MSRPTRSTGASAPFGGAVCGSEGQRGRMLWAPPLRFRALRSILYLNERLPKQGGAPMAVSQDILKELRAEGEDVDLSWLEAPAAQRGLRIAPGRRGLTLEEIATGSYGNIPSTSRNQSGRMRGARAPPHPHNTHQMWPFRSASWSESAMLLYEEAVQRQWSSATDVPWAELPDLPEELEMAMSPLCTFLTQVEFIAGDEL